MALADTTTVNIYDEIGVWGVTASAFRAALDTIHSPRITLNINSPGGDVFDGIAIYNDLVSHPASVHVSVRGLAASAASLIAMAGDEIEIADTGFIMIHNAWTIALGDAHEMTETAKMLAKVDTQLAKTYAARTGIDVKDVRALMDAETWLDSGDALEKGFVDRVLSSDNEAAEARAAFDLTGFKNVPRALAGPKRSAHANVPQAVDVSPITDALARLTKTMKGI